MSPKDASRHFATLRISADHPALEGHFPGNPIVPGVVLLDCVVELAERWLAGSLRVTGIRQAKFMSPLGPDVEVSVSLRLDGPTLEYRVEQGSTALARGSLAVARPVAP